MTTQKHVLIVDDSDFNRMLLSDLLEDNFAILEATDGSEAIEILKNPPVKIDIMLLDLIMPKVGGLDVLKFMKESDMTDRVPVIIISSETDPDILVQAYELGATDYIMRPYNAVIVTKRIQNTIKLFEKQDKLVSLVMEQVKNKEDSNKKMITVLSHIVEFRNGESGLHVVHISIITGILLRVLGQKYEKYAMTPTQIANVSLASSLHDVGKVAIPEEVLNKPGRLTEEEFAIIKKHSSIGSDMLESLPFYGTDPLFKEARNIARWHHERYDGRGYPDGLKGDDIPISAQVVALADVYDALTSERCYKAAYSHEKAMDMIQNGECGSFNPELLKAFKESEDEIVTELAKNNQLTNDEEAVRDIARQIFIDNDLKSVHSENIEG